VGIDKGLTPISFWGLDGVETWPEGVEMAGGGLLLRVCCGTPQAGDGAAWDGPAVTWLGRGGLGRG
jgi:hypothetical protein